jgi:hypothetical protein
MLAVLDQDDCRDCVRVFAVEGLILAIVGFALKGLAGSESSASFYSSEPPSSVCSGGGG